MSTAALPALLLLLTLTTTSEAQHAPQAVRGPRPSPVLAAVPRGPLQQGFALDSVQRRIPPTHWKEGAFVGGLTAGLGLALFMEGLCRTYGTSSNCGAVFTAGFLGGGVMGGIVGALIGGQFPKAEDD